MAVMLVSYLLPAIYAFDAIQVGLDSKATP